MFAPVFQKFEQYTRPQSNQILARYQLHCLKQNGLPLEDFVTKARILIGEAGYGPLVKDEMLRDTLVFGIESHKVYKDAISKGNSLTFQAVYDLAMDAMTQGTQEASLNSVSSKSKQPKSETRNPRRSKQHMEIPKSKFKFQFKGCFRCGNKHDQGDRCSATHAKCLYCGKIGHFQSVYMKKKSKQVNE